MVGEFGKQIVLVAVGGAAGSVLRFSMGVFGAYLGASPLVAVTIINWLGCFAIGWWSGRPEAVGLETNVLVATGILGGFTTFSAFGLLSVREFQVHGWIWSLGMIVVHVIIGLLAVVLGSRMSG